MKCSAVSLSARKTNLDRYLINEERECFAVFDGTTAGGEFSELFVNWLLEMVRELVSRLEDPPYYFVAERATALKNLVTEANTELPKRISEYYGGQIQTAAVGAGSTLALAYYGGYDWVIVNSGDSKVFLVRHGKLQQLSYDDTEFNIWIEDGLVKIVDGKEQYKLGESIPGRGRMVKFAGIEVDGLEAFKARSRMVRWIGNGAKPHVNIVPTEPGDILILLTDGAEHLLKWYAKEEKEIVQAAVAVSKGKAEHLLAAFPSFWRTYKPGERLWDDATALVVYKGSKKTEM